MSSTSKRAATSSARYTFSDDEEALEDKKGTAHKNVKEKKKAQKPKTAVCTICNKKYTDRYCLARHMEVHTETRDFSCDICDASFKTSRYLSRHRKRVHGPPTHECDFCGKMFPTPSRLVQHRLVHTGEKPHKCEVCGKRFRASYSLNTHRYMHTNEKPFKCAYCPYACRDSSTLRKHQERHAPTMMFYQCTDCGKRYTTKARLKDHVLANHNGEIKLQSCQKCDGKFKSEKALKIHIRMVHEKEFRATCEVCGLEIASRYNMSAHLRAHLKIRPYKCRYKACGLRFKDKGTLNKHAVLHKPRTLSCDVCGRLFARRCRLNDHMRLHGNERREMFCDHCGFSFDNKARLIRHMMKHMRHRNTYVCDVCKYVTHKKLSIEKHMQYGHGDEDDVHCKICDKDYKLHAYLITHYYNRHGVRYKTVRNIKFETSVTIKEEPGEPMPDVEVNIEEIQDKESLANIITDVALDRDSTDIQYSKSVLMEDIAKIEGRISTKFRKKLRGRAGRFDEQNTVYARKELDVKKRIKKLLTRVRQKKYARILEEARQQYNKRITALSYKKKENNLKIKYVNINQSNSNETEQKQNENSKVNTKNEKTDKNLDKAENVINAETAAISVEIVKTNNENNDTLGDGNVDDTASLANDTELCENGYAANVYEDMFDVEENPVGNDNPNLDEMVIRDNSNKNNRLNKINETENNDKRIDLKESELISEETIMNHGKENSSEPNEMNAIVNVEINKNVLDEINNCEVNANNKQNDTEILDLDDNVESEISPEKTNINYGTENSSVSNEMNAIVNVEINENVLDVINNYEVNANNKQNDNDKLASDDNVESKYGNDDKEDCADENKGKNMKLKINTHQCYICFKLYETKQKLLDHCQIHFDVCSDIPLKKCPLCDYVTKLNITRHIKTVHGITITLPYHVKDKHKNSEDTSRYYYDINDKIVKEIEIIPSVKNLNKIAYVKIDKNNRINKDLTVAKTKLVKKSGEWVVEHENLDLNKVNSEFILPEFDKNEIKRLKYVGDQYLDVIKALGRLAARRKAKMLYPCNGCEKLCRTFAALKLHSRRHEANPKPFKKKVWKHKLKGVEKKAVKVVNPRKKDAEDRLRQAEPKKVQNKNKHRCDKALIDFYEKNVKGADIEFWQFLKIYNRMNKDHADNLKDLKETNEFGDYTIEDNLNDTASQENTEVVINNNNHSRKIKNNGRKVRNCVNSRMILSKKERLMRARIKEQLRKKINGSQ